MSAPILALALTFFPAASDAGPSAPQPDAVAKDNANPTGDVGGKPVASELAKQPMPSAPPTSAVGQPVGGMSLADFADRTRPAVVHIKTKGASGRTLATGTGFIVQGHVITNDHVIDGAASVDLTFDDGTTRPAQGFYARDAMRDLAVVAVQDAHSTLTLGASDTVRQGQRIIVLGNPQGLAGTLSEGIISAVRQGGVEGADDGVLTGRILQITAPISPGSSGSPVFDIDGRVIGVATAQRATGQNLNFVVPVEDVSALLARVDTSKREPFSSVRWVNWAVSGAFFIILGGLLWLAGRTRRPKASGRDTVSRIH